MRKTVNGEVFVTVCEKNSQLVSDEAFVAVSDENSVNAFVVV